MTEKIQTERGGFGKRGYPKWITVGDVRTGQLFIPGIRFSKQPERHPSIRTVCDKTLHKNILGWHWKAVARDTRKMWACISSHSFNRNHAEKAYKTPRSWIYLRRSFATPRMMSNLIEFQIEEIFWLIFCFQLYSFSLCGYLSSYWMHPAICFLLHRLGIQTILSHFRP